MTAVEQSRQLPAPAGGPMIRTLGGIAMLSGFLVVLVYQLTLPAIMENQRRAIEKAVFQVIPGAVSRTGFLFGPDGLAPAQESGANAATVYAGYDQQGALKGVALEAAAQGYQDIIKLLYGWDPVCQCITGIYVLRMTETPGLGDRIAFDPGFLANFEALDARLNAQGSALLHPIVTVKHGRKTQPWQIDAISGATVSSKAVGKALNESAQSLLPRLAPQVARMEGKE